MLISPNLIKIMQPKSVSDIVNGVVYCGGFLDAFNKLSGFIAQQGSSTAILRGGPGSGKKTLIREVCRNYNNPSMEIDVEGETKNKKSTKARQRNTTKETEEDEESDKKTVQKLRMVSVYPEHHHDDFLVLRKIADQLGMKPDNSLSNLVNDIQNRKGMTYKGKILIVLYNFEEFTRSKQSLLYNLVHLTQHGQNVKLLGVTCSLNCTSNLEKRVRSRLNALFYKLSSPYSNRDEYLQFASQLLGGYNIEGNLHLKLVDMYIFGTRKISDLKRFLSENSSWKTGKLEIIIEEFKEPTTLIENPYLDKMLNSLTIPQIHLLILACHHQCFGALRNNESRPRDFSLSALKEHALNNHIKIFDTTSTESISHAEILMLSCLIKPMNKNEHLNVLTRFTLQISPIELREALKRNEDCCGYRELWRKLR